MILSGVIAPGSPHLDEVLAALCDAASESGVTPELGARVQADRGSAMRHLGLRTPIRRGLVKKGFSFTNDQPADVLAAWNSIWWGTDVADVMFTPLDHYRDRLVEDPAAFWVVVAGWIDRVDNWAHASLETHRGVMSNATRRRALGQR